MRSGSGLVVVICGCIISLALLGVTISVSASASGVVVAWGSNDCGQCNVPTPNTGFVAVSAGNSHSLGLRTDGSIVAWGDNGYGQCNVPTPNTGFVAVSAGDSHSVGLKTDGSIVAWGDNGYGQCNVPTPNTGFVAVSAGNSHSLGLKTDGSIVAWGYSGYGACNVPVPNTGFVAVAAGYGYSLGLKTDGSIVGWVYNEHGACNAPAPNTGFAAVSTDTAHSVGLKFDGSIVTWGYNGYGQCNVPTPNTGFVAVSVGWGHSLGLKSDGSVVAWGHNGYGQRNVPTPNTGFVAVSAGGRHSVGIRTPIVETPTLTPAGGSYNSEQTVGVNCATPGATIHYTTSGQDPTEDDLVVTSGGSVLVDRTMTLKAKAWKTGILPSGVASANYALVVAAPTLSPGSGGFDSDQDVLVACSTPGATIHYSMSGNDPTESDNLVISGTTLLVPVNPATTLKVKAYRTGFQPSEVISALYRLLTLYHVRPTGSDSNDGLTWQTAKSTIQAALNGAQSGDHVWVAAGVYVEKITLKDGVALYGGFVGNETLRSERDLLKNETVIDGNSSGTVVTSPAGATQITRIDGFTVRNGMAQFGAGIRCQDSSPTIANNTITGNSASTETGNAGGGIGCGNSSAVIADNLIRGNSTSGWACQGAGIACGGGSPTITGNVITENRASCGSGLYDNAKGGGIYCDGALAMIVDNTVTLNYAGGTNASGGGIYCVSQPASQSIIARNIVRENTALKGAGVYLSDQPSYLANNLIRGNTASTGGGVYLANSSSTMTNNTIVQNRADAGGGIYSSLAGGPATIANNVIALNSSGVRMAAGSLDLTHDCVWGNISYQYSGITDPTGSNGNISADPIFGDSEYGNFRLEPSSPCVNSGVNTVANLPETDMDGSPRILGTAVDIGAYECDGTVQPDGPYVVVRVSTEGDDGNDGSSWANTKRTVQSAINSVDPKAALDAEVWVRAGTYDESVYIRPLVYLYGGFSGSENTREQRDWQSNLSVLRGPGSGSVVTTGAGHRNSTLDGFGVENGTVGVVCSNSSPVIRNNTITANNGGIACNNGAAPLITENDIVGNGSDCVFGGSGISCNSSNAIITRNRVRDNMGMWSGGIDCRTSSPIISSNVLVGNGGGFASAIRLWSGSATIVGNTIASNWTPLGLDTTIDSSGFATPTIANNIIAFNDGSCMETSSATVIKNNCAYGNTGGDSLGGVSSSDGNISADPLFVDVSVGDYHLQMGSACIDAGWNDAPSLGDIDFDGSPRVWNGVVDIGAYESKSPVTVPQLKRLPNGALTMVNAAIVSAAWNNVFYIESDGRNSGIRVEKFAHGRVEGTRANVVGTVKTNTDGERYIEASSTEDGGDGSVDPIGLVHKLLGGGSAAPGVAGQEGVAGGAGLNNIGLLIRAWGKVTQVGEGYLYIDDGSALKDGTSTGAEENVGVRVICDPAGYSSGEKVEVTGISSCFWTPSGIARRILTRKPEDIRKLTGP